MDQIYSPEQQKTGRFWWLLFSLINSLAFQFIAGNVILLFLIRLGANKTLIGIVSSFFYASYLFMPVGRVLSGKYGIVRTFSLAWIFRSIVILPILFTPFLSGSPRLAIIMTVAGYFAFQMIRGAGLVSLSPLMSELSHGKDQGRFLSLSRMISDIAILTGSLIVAFFLGEDAPLYKYAISFAAGILLGYIGVLCLIKIPEIHRPVGHRDKSFKESFVNIIELKRFRKFFIGLILLTFVAGVLRPFILVYAKDVYSLSDNRVLFLTVSGSLGAITMGLISRNLLDRLGAKPMMLIWTIMMFALSLTVVFTPLLKTPLFWIFLILLFYFAFMGLTGFINTTQTYFFSMLRAEEQLNSGILFFLATGISGVAGSSLGGICLDLFQGPIQMTILLSYQLLFGFVSLILFFSIIAVWKMDRLGAPSLGKSLWHNFSLHQRSRGQL